MLQFVYGRLAVRIACADMEGFLSAVNKEGILIQDIVKENDLSVHCKILHKNLEKMELIASKKGATIHVLKRQGLYWKLKNMMARPVLLIGLSLLLCMALWLPGKILFIRVEGNFSVPEKLILEQAELCGLRFGTDRSIVRSEKLKNGLLEKIDRLQWVGVNTAGCVATISVRERTDTEEKQALHGVSSIVAVCDGVIESCTVTRGNALCKVGQAVKAGEVLISGYTDCGISIQATRAEGEVYATTCREITVISPANFELRGDRTGETKKYSLLIGKKRINLYKDSGILPTSCDKIYEEFYLKLPGGFQLPVAIAVETWYSYDTCVSAASEEASHTSMAQYAQSYLKSQMIGGSIAQCGLKFEHTEDACILLGEYICLEMIGRVRSEEIIVNNG